MSGRREEWMLGDGFGDILSGGTDSSRKKKEAEKVEAKRVAAETIHPRELNRSLKEADTANRPAPPSVPSSSSWTRMMVQKSLDRVKRGEASLEDVAKERFGGMEAFEKACKSSGISLSAYLSRPEKPEVKTEKLFAPAEKKVVEEPVAVEDVNKLMAKKLKAEMMGNFELARELEEKIAKMPKETQTKGHSVNILPREARGRDRIGEDASISKMVEHEKLAAEDEFDDELARKIAKTSRFSEKMEGMEEFSDRYGEGDAGGSGRERKKAKIDPETAKRQIALGRYKKMERIQETCWFCLDSERSDKSLIIAIGQYSYLALPKYGQLHPLHCQIIPMEHSQSMLQCSSQESVWDELRNWKKCLLQMAASINHRMVFLEASMNFKDCSHCFIDCVPLPATLKVDPSGYFKKALMECDVEWSQHKKLFDTTDASSGGLRRAVHQRFPYLYVDFRLDQGYAHVIEDEDMIRPDFLRNLSASLLGVTRDKTKRTEAETKISFAKAFDPHDWTKLLQQD